VVYWRLQDPSKDTAKAAKSLLAEGKGIRVGDAELGDNRKPPPKPFAAKTSH